MIGGVWTPAQGLRSPRWLASWLAARPAGWLENCPKDACKRPPDACVAFGPPWASMTSRKQKGSFVHLLTFALISEQMLQSGGLQTTAPETKLW